MPLIYEAKINTEDRNKLPDSAFGIPSKRKYPLTDKDGNLDEKHILQAVRFFNKADESDKKELAKNILKAAKKLDMDYSNWEEVLKYAGEEEETVKEYMTNESWTLEDAKKIAMRIHNKADADKHPLISNQNCQLCTWCAEANFRGMDILPRPIHSPRDIALSQTGENIVKNPIKIEMENEDHLVSTIKDAGPSRWYAHVMWKDSKGGHEFIYLNYEFEIYLMDAQQGILAQMNDPSVKGYIEGINWEESYIARMDNKELETEMLESVNSMDKFIPWDPKVDIPYMREHDMLSDDDLEEAKEKLGYEEYYIGGDDDDDDDHEVHEPDDCYCESKKIIDSSDERTLSKLICEGWKVNGSTNDGKYILIKEGYSDEAPENVTLRPATEKDLDMVLTWTLETINEKYRHNQKLIDEINEENRDNIDSIKIIVGNTKDIGMYQAYEIDDGEWWYLAEIYLIPEYRGKGIGSYLIKKDIEEHDKIVLRVDPDNVRAIKLYESLGFVITKKEKNSWIMRLDKTKKSEIFESGDFDEYAKDVDLTDARGPITESLVMEFDHKSEKLSVKAPNTDKVYFGSPRKYARGIKTDRPLFVTPFMGIASIFIYGDLNIQNKVPHGSYNLEYEEWVSSSEEEMSKPFKEVHVYVEGYPELEPYVIENTGYIHTVDVSKYKNDFYRYGWMSKKIEYLIDTEESFVDVESVQEVTVRYCVSGKASKNPKLGPHKNEQTIQEGYWQDIRNGVNPKSKKLWFHISFDDKLDEKGPMTPRIPTWIEDIKKDGYTTSDGKKTHDLEEVMKDTGRYENYTTPRVCFSPSIEGALNSIINMWKLMNKDFPGKQLYVYIPEKPLSQYKHKTNKELIKDKEVFDAGTTGESWILEPVKVKFYGSIQIDKVKDNGRKHKVLTRPGFEKQTSNPMDNYIGRFTYKWHWLIHPSVIKQGKKYEKAEKEAQSPLEVCNDIIAELKDFKYGLVKDGKLSTSNNSVEDYDTLYKFMTLDEFEKYRGGICYDYVEWEEAYLKDHGKKYSKYYLYANTDNNDTHTFILVKNNDGYIYLESAFKDIEGVYPVKNLQEAVDIITKAMFKMNGNNKLKSFNYYVWEYKGHPEYGSSLKQCAEYYIKGKFVLEGTATNPKKKGD